MQRTQPSAVHKHITSHYRNRLDREVNVTRGVTPHGDRVAFTRRARVCAEAEPVYRFGAAAVMAARSSVSFALITAALSGPILISSFCPADRDSSPGSA